MLDIQAEYGLKPPQFFALQALDEPVPMSSVANVLRCDRSAVTWITDRLEERGYVERRSDERDRRVKLLALTEEGKRVREEIRRRLAVPPDALAQLSRVEQRELRDLLRKALERVVPAEHAAFLRGVNVGRHHRVSGAELRAVFEGAGLTEVATFRASGNVVFSGAADAARIEAALEAALGYEPKVFLRTAGEMRAIATHAPFPAATVAGSKGKLRSRCFPPSRPRRRGRRCWRWPRRTTRSRSATASCTGCQAAAPRDGARPEHDRDAGRPDHPADMGTVEQLAAVLPSPAIPAAVSARAARRRSAAHRPRPGS